MGQRGDGGALGLSGSFGGTGVPCLTRLFLREVRQCPFCTYNGSPSSCPLIICIFAPAFQLGTLPLARFCLRAMAPPLLVLVHVCSDARWCADTADCANSGREEYVVQGFCVVGGSEVVRLTFMTALPSNWECGLVAMTPPTSLVRRLGTSGRLQEVRLFLRASVLYSPWIPSEHCQGTSAVECVAAHLPLRLMLQQQLFLSQRVRGYPSCDWFS